MLLFKDEVFDLSFPKFYNVSGRFRVFWKIDVKKITSADCFVKFIVKSGKIVSKNMNNNELFILNDKIAIMSAYKEMFESMEKIHGAWDLRCTKFYEVKRFIF